jgi:hypothetical protein
VIWSKTGIVTLREAESVARVRGWRVLSFEVRETSDIDGALRAASGAGAGCALVYASSILYTHPRLAAESALKRRMPTMFPLDAFVDAGGLAS